MDTVRCYSISPHGFRRPDGEGKIPPFRATEIPASVFWFLAQDERMLSVEEYNSDYLEGLNYKQLQQHARVRRQYTDEEIDAKQPEEDLREALRIDAEE